jgi:hypothetical protein
VTFKFPGADNGQHIVVLKDIVWNIGIGRAQPDNFDGGIIEYFVTG